MLKIFLLFSVPFFILIIFEIKSLVILIVIKLSELLNINLHNYDCFSSLLEKLTYDFYVWKIFFDVSIFINLFLFLLFLYFFFMRKRKWRWHDSFLMLLPFSLMGAYIALWPGFFDINFFNFVSLDFLDQHIKIYHNLLLIYELKGFNLIDFLSDETHFISNFAVFNIYLFYLVYLFLLLFIIADAYLNEFAKVLYIFLLSFFVKYLSFIFLEIFYYFSIIPYKVIYDESLQDNLYNSMNYVQAFLFTL